MIYFFSGTGNSRAVSSQLAELTHDKAISCLDARISEDISGGQPDVLGLVFPVHAWGPPKVYATFLRECLHALPNHPPSYTYMVCTCGDDIGRTDRLIRNTLLQQGITLDSAFSITMPNTYIGLPGFNVDKPALAIKKLQEAMQKVKEISVSISSRAKGISDVRPGSMPSLKTYVLRPLFHRFLTGDRKFRTSQCRQCGTCAKICPLHNIVIEKASGPSWQGNCTDCLACYHSCPFHCIRYGHNSNEKGQYLYERETLMSRKRNGEPS